MTEINAPWTPFSWHAKQALQQPVYKNNLFYEEILSEIRNYPPLVSAGEIEKLRQQIAEAGEGKRFILQGGDCAERFLDCRETVITNKIKILLQMSVILTHAARCPVTRIGRIAGQYCKPRSSDTELIAGKMIPSYKGDSINGFEPSEESRTPDANRLLKSYFLSSVTINFIRSLIDGGFADLHQPYNWNLHAIEQTSKWPEYKEILDKILDAIQFMDAFGGLNSNTLGRIEFFTSHEGLHLKYEEVLTREDKKLGGYYNLGAHMLWIGDRTRGINDAHVEYFRGLKNPVGIKISKKITSEELFNLINILNPGNQKGRILLISRMGREHIRNHLPALIEKIRSEQRNVTWTCDPMHGNTITTGNEVKTRHFEAIMEELEETFLIHHSMKSYLAGVHFELTGEDVTECVGGAINLRKTDLLKNYQSYCDPRLNYSQSLEMAFLISKMLSSKLK